MVRASARASWACSGFCVGVVKNEEVRPAHVVGVEVEMGFFEACLKVGDGNEELAIVLDYRPSLRSQSGCPLCRFV